MAEGEIQQKDKDKAAEKKQDEVTYQEEIGELRDEEGKQRHALAPLHLPAFGGRREGLMAWPGRPALERERAR